MTAIPIWIALASTVGLILGPILGALIGGPVCGDATEMDR